MNGSHRWAQEHMREAGVTTLHGGWDADDVVYDRFPRGRAQRLPAGGFPTRPQRRDREHGGASGMHTLRLAGVVAAFAVLLLASLLVWMTFDRYSHSTRDTVLTFILLMGPIWAGALGGAWAWLHPTEPRDPPE
jgi:hypothetical protein